MKTKFFTCGLLFVSALNLFGQAKMNFSVKSYDFGYFEHDNTIPEFKFVFKNTGNEELQIYGVYDSGPTKSRASKETFKSGESGYIVVAYNIGFLGDEDRKDLKVQ